MRRKIRIKPIIISIVIIGLIILTMYLFFRTDFFRTKRSAFMRYFQNTPEALNVFETNEFKDYNEEKKTKPYIRKADIQIQSSSNVADTNILDKVKMNIVQKVNAEEDKANVEASVSHDGNKLFEMSGIKDQEEYGLYSNEIAKTYICVRNEDLKRIVNDSNLQISLPNTIQIYDFDDIVETTDVEKDKIKECLDIMKNDVSQSAYTKDSKKIKINDKKYNTKCYTLNLSKEESANLQIDLLNKIMNDSFLMDYITSKAKLLNADEEYTNINSLKDIMNKRIKALSKNKNEAEELKITVYENKQKNIRTEVDYGNNSIAITHLKEDEGEFSSLKINNKTYSILKENGKYTISYNSKEDIEKNIKIEYSQEGSLENNDIKNKMVITQSEGIKSITYLYNDSVEFSNDIGKLNGFDNVARVTLNDYNDEEIKNFAEALKSKINSVYISKGASIGINLDPIF